ncbi:hypothetical protein RYX36_015136 [Vicia faba]
MMTDHQRIHPANDLESQTKPTIPLYPRNTSKSDGHDPPIPKRHFPVRHSQPPKKKRSCCCRFLCCTFTILLVLIIAISITIGTLYLVFRPKLPKYSVDRLRISQFNLSDNNNLFVTFDVTVTARNPNKKIGIYYFLNNSKYTGVGLNSEDDWMVLVLTTTTPTGTSTRLESPTTY